MSQLLTKQQMRNCKSKLTRAKNTGDPRKVLQAATECLELFDDYVYPDNWHLWQRAKEDAEWAVNSGVKFKRFL